MNGKRITEVAEKELLEKELARVRYKGQYRRILRSTVYALVVVAAIAILLATTFMPVLRIYGSSMAPTLNEGEIVLALKGSNFAQGDIVAMYIGNKLLVKRVIAGPGQWVDIESDGTFLVDGNKIDEPYLTEKAYGDVNIELPYQVPDNRWFLAGDNRSSSLDSRNTSIGCIAEEQIVGRIVLRIWPFNEIGLVRDGTHRELIVEATK